MPPLVALLVLAALIAAATAAGLLLRARSGRLRREQQGDRVTAAHLHADALGARATLVQLSTPTCARCPATARLLGRMAGQRRGVVHLDVDVARHADVAARFGVLQTPTVLLLDRDGVVRARVGGPPREPELAGALDALPV